MEIPLEQVRGSMLPLVEVELAQHDALFDIAVDCVSEATGVKRVDILGTVRTDRVIFARFSVYKLVRDELCAYYPPGYCWIASKFSGTGKKGSGIGGKHHGSIIHGIESLCNRISTNAKEFKLYSLILGKFELRRADHVGVDVVQPHNSEASALKLAAARCAKAIKNNEGYLLDVMKRLAELEEEKEGKDESLVQDKLASNG